MTTVQKIIVAMLLALGLGGSLWSAHRRVAVERANKTMALCVDDLEVRQLAALTGAKPEALLTKLKQAGITHIAVSERTLGELLQTGEVRLRPEMPGGLWGAPSLVVSVATRLQAAGYYDIHKRLMGTGYLVSVPPVVLTMPKLGLLYDTNAVATAHASGLAVVARPAPDYLLTPRAIEASMQAASATGAPVVLFNGVSVAGGTELAGETAAVLQRLGLQFAFVELVPQEGAANLAAALAYRIIRTHSISQEEMIKTPASRGLDRFVLAVCERNVRLCYVRLLLNPQPDIVQANVDYLRSIHDALAKAGYVFGNPQPFQPLSVPTPALALMALGVVGGGLWLLMEMLRPRDCWFWWLLGLGGIGSAGAGVAAPSIVQALFPLLTAVIFPTLAVLTVASLAASAPSDLRSDTSPWPQAIGLFLGAAIITAVGGLLIAGMLSSLPYMMQIAQFRGVKFAQLLPLLLVFLTTLGRTHGDSNHGRGWPLLRSGLSRAANAFVRYWHAGAIFLVLGLVAFMIMRSGNESAVEVSALELKLRALLDQVLFVRPRTKEILFGFPALLMGLTLLLRRRPRTVWVWLTFGVIGLISMTNTFCHLHTPLLVSLARVANGIWVGLMVGIGWWVAKAVLERVCTAIGWNEAA